MQKQTNYPSPAERAEIIERRLALLDKLAPLLAPPSGDPQEQKIDRLAQKHGQQAVDFVRQKFQQVELSDDGFGGNARLYREYRLTFARFGGARPFLDKETFEKLTMAYMKAVGRRSLRALIPFLSNKRGARERELHDQLLLQVEYWEDITPPAVPPQPADFAPPPANSYTNPVQAILDWGWPDGQRDYADRLQNPQVWPAALPELKDMVLDEGLLEGWPAQPASWAPYHALHLLGHLGADQYATTLLELVGRENDWLSDRVPSVLGQMGPAAEALLRDYIEDDNHHTEKRRYALRGLEAIAGQHPARRDEIVDQLAELLENSSYQDNTANGYLVASLNRLQAVSTKEIILNAFRQNKVNLEIIKIEDIDFLTLDEKVANKSRRTQN